MFKNSKNKTEQADISLIASVISKEKEWPKLFAKCFSTEEGKEVLAYIKFLAFSLAAHNL